MSAARYCGLLKISLFWAEQKWIFSPSPPQRRRINPRRIQRWPGEKLQILALTIDDATRFIVGAGFIEAETTFAHLAHVRNIFLTHGLPNDFYTDGLSLFGHESRKAGDTDTLSQFQRALSCLGISHLVAKDPQSKGKIELQFGFRQKRLPALFAMERVQNRAQANELLAAQIDWYHQHRCQHSSIYISRFTTRVSFRKPERLVS